MTDTTKHPGYQHNYIDGRCLFAGCTATLEEEMHPDTDEHRAGCTSCQYRYDSKQPDPRPTDSTCTRCGKRIWKDADGWRHDSTGTLPICNSIPEPNQPIPPDPEQLNDGRADAAALAVYRFAADFGELPSVGGLDDEANRDLLAQNIADLLCDLGHLCDRRGLLLAGLWETAAMHYGEETEQQGSQLDTVPTV